MLAIRSIKEHAEKKKIETDESIIITCEYISHLNKDEDFNNWLRDREEEQEYNN